MKKLIAYINNNVLVKIVPLQTAGILTKIIAGLLTSKAIAVFIGAEGLALIGNLQNFVNSFQTISIYGLYNGAVKYIGKFKDDVLWLTKTISTVFYVGFIATILVSFFCYFNAGLINDIIFPTYNNYEYIIKIFAIALPFYTLNMFSFSIMNGFSKYKILIVINIIGQVLSVLIALILIFRNKVDGALIAVVVAEAITFLITLVGVINRRSLIPLIKTDKVSFSLFKRLNSYSLMALFTAAIMPLIAIAIRSYIIENMGYKDAGFWEAMTRISKYYLMFVSALLAYYIMPRFSEINDLKEFKKEVFSFYKAVIPILALGLFIIYLLKSYIVKIIFTNEFKPVEDLFLWQLLGDFIKVLSMVIAYQFLAKKMFWHYILTEVFLVIILYATSIYFIDLYDNVKGAVIAHFVSYVMYYGIISLIFFNNSLFGIERGKN